MYERYDPEGSKILIPLKRNLWICSSSGLPDSNVESTMGISDDDLVVRSRQSRIAVVISESQMAGTIIPGGGTNIYG